MTQPVVNKKNTRNVRVALNEQKWNDFKQKTQDEGHKTSKVLAQLIHNYMGG